MKTTANEVRQILMNELGLTREYIRGIAEDIIRQTVANHISQLEQRGIIEKMVRSEIERLGRNNSWDSDSIKSMVSRAASEQAKIFIQEHLTIKEAP